MDKLSSAREHPSFSPEIFLTDRARRVAILQELCERWYNQAPNQPAEAPPNQSELETLFQTSDKSIVSTIRFILDAFRTAKKRKDGKHLAVHSLELYQKARSLGVADERVLKTVLLHDVLEDTPLTPEAIATLDSGMVPFAKTMTEERGKNLTREQALRQFIQQLRTAPLLNEADKPVVIQAEIIDRLDDISDIGYLTEQLQNEAIRQAAEHKLGEKMAKCRFTIDELTAGQEDPEIQRLRGVFDRVYEFQMRQLKEPPPILRN